MPYLFELPCGPLEIHLLRYDLPALLAPLPASQNFRWRKRRSLRCAGLAWAVLRSALAALLAAWVAVLVACAAWTELLSAWAAVLGALQGACAVLLSVCAVLMAAMQQEDHLCRQPQG